MSASRSKSLSLLPSICLVAAVAFGGTVQAAESASAPAALLTESEADRIAEAEAAAHAKRRADRKQSIESVPAEQEWELGQGKRTIVFRRVSPPERAPASKRPTAPVPERRFPDTEIEALLADRPTPVPIHFHATVYLHSGSVLGSEVALWHADTEHHFWTNLDFRLLQVFGSFRHGDRQYHPFGFIEEVTRSGEAERSRRAAGIGVGYQSRWKAPPVVFPANAPEYAWGDGAEEVPAEAIRKAEDLLAHLAANRAELETARRNAARLGEARRKQREARPPQPGDEVINFYPLSERRETR